jgi:hypothetical protein
LPVKILEANDRVAEVQLICDCCGKIVRTSLIAKNEVAAAESKKIECWQCKRATAAKNKA